ncbi:MAG TPA: thiolase domain-containing protein, partial [Phenylobacterium sp.]|uniref:thiolase domain-containing protein n=1 Tax=Phenylobacterium sp. TaxID=1871053 RepID=UPI002B459513
MSTEPRAFIAGLFEHPTRRADGLSRARLHADVAYGALADAGLTTQDVDGYFCAADAPGAGGMAMAEYLGLTKLRHLDSTETGGSSYLFHVQHAVDAIRAGRCSVALITMADNQLAERRPFGLTGVDLQSAPDSPFTDFVPAPLYAMVAQRHMYEYGTTSAQLAWVKVAASHHAQHNPHALLRDVVTVEQVLESPLVADPLHRLDCCVMTDGGGAIVIAREEIARDGRHPLVRVKGSGSAIGHASGGRIDITRTAGTRSAALAFEEAGIRPGDVKYASLYDSFTITVLIQLEDIGFCERGRGGAFVADGNLISGVGRLPFNTDGGGLCSNHPGNRGGITKLLEAARQARGTAHPAVQV